MQIYKCFIVAILSNWCGSICKGHDLWIEPSSAMVRTGEYVHVNFKLGNGNQGRRDFTTSGLIDPKDTLTGVTLPTRTSMDMVQGIIKGVRPLWFAFGLGNSIILGILIEEEPCQDPPEPMKQEVCITR